MAAEITPQTTKPQRLQTAKILMWIAAASALIAGLSSIPTVMDASNATKVVETWRCYGYFVFAALFALLAWRPHNYRGVWEIVIINKLALTVTAISYAMERNIADASTVLTWDGGLSITLVVAYILARGWQSPNSESTTPRGGV